MAIKTVLCVEDDRFIGEMYVRSLKKAGYDVTWMVDGNDGLDALRSDDTDLVPNSKILIMTNFEQDDRAKAEVTGRVDGYLIKADITPRKLLEVIQEMDSGKKVGDLTQR